MAAVWQFPTRMCNEARAGETLGRPHSIPTNDNLIKPPGVRLSATESGWRLRNLFTLTQKIMECQLLILVNTRKCKKHEIYKLSETEKQIRGYTFQLSNTFNSSHPTPSKLVSWLNVSDYSFSYCFLISIPFLFLYMWLNPKSLSRGADLQSATELRRRNRTPASGSSAICRSSENVRKVPPALCWLWFICHHVLDFSTYTEFNKNDSSYLLPSKWQKRILLQNKLLLISFFMKT